MQKSANKRFVAVGENGRRLGEDHQRAKLTNDQVDAIVEAYATGIVSYATLASTYEVSKSTIRDIVKGRRRAQTPVGFKAVDK